MKEITEITQAKGETSILQTGKLCYNAININVFVLVPEFERAQSLVSHPIFYVSYRRFME